MPLAGRVQVQLRSAGRVSKNNLQIAGRAGCFWLRLYRRQQAASSGGLGGFRAGLAPCPALRAPTMAATRCGSNLCAAGAAVVLGPAVRHEGTDRVSCQACEAQTQRVS